MLDKKAKSKIFHSHSFPKSTKGQIADTMTWVVATVVVAVILTIAIFVAQVSGSKGEVYESKIADPLAEKSFYSFLLVDGVWEKLRSDGNLNNSNGVLAEKIFDVYRKDYTWGIWLGIVEEESLENDYFGERPASYAVGSYAAVGANSIVSKKVKLNENQDIELVLMDQK